MSAWVTQNCPQGVDFAREWQATPSPRARSLGSEREFFACSLCLEFLGTPLPRPGAGPAHRLETGPSLLVRSRTGRAHSKGHFPAPAPREPKRNASVINLLFCVRAPEAHPTPSPPALHRAATPAQRAQATPSARTHPHTHMHTRSHTEHSLHRGQTEMQAPRMCFPPFSPFPSSTPPRTPQPLGRQCPLLAPPPHTHRRKVCSWPISACKRAELAFPSRAGEGQAKPRKGEGLPFLALVGSPQLCPLPGPPCPPAQ